MTASGTARRPRLSPEALFVLGGIAQYSGASIAVRLFDDVAVFRPRASRADAA